MSVSLSPTVGVTIARLLAVQSSNVAVPIAFHAEHFTPRLFPIRWRNGGEGAFEHYTATMTLKLAHGFDGER
jgi:hypothetical protein